jgi:hypothetical protein
LLDEDDLKSRPDPVVARLAGREEHQKIAHDNPIEMRFLQSSNDNPV